MKIIVCGAGKIGQNLAKYLTHSENEIVVIDTSSSILKEMSSAMDIQTIKGNASYPDVLEQASAKDADILISMTGSDEVNILSCYMANNIFKIPIKIARISSPSFLDGRYVNKISKNSNMISKIISPEIEVASSVLRSINAQWADEVILLADEKMRFIGMECDENSILINASVRQIARILPDANLRIVMIIRDEKPIFPSIDDKIMAGDEIYFSIPASDLKYALEKMNISVDLNKRIIILGGGKIGYHLLRLIEASHIYKNVTLVEKDEKKAIALAEISENVTITCGDILEDRIQEEIGFENADIVISLMGEELNIIASLLAKNKGVKRTIATIENDIYDRINDALGVDILVDSSSIIVSSILRYVRKGKINAGYSLKGDMGEILEGRVIEESSVIDKTVHEISQMGIVVVYIQRGGEFIVVTDDDVFKAGDKIALFALDEDIKTAEKMFIAE